ncbi:EamA-like transporter family protein [Candidatus Bilamarchaeum dharawalense]|uniref:EamA-like transporter family protein n=1 Tax=Candidatus Bilamarchaeum dharawalense TaxID=2885759 RepID=A0A5E4LQN6_9ARCH|nr:EamA-like transporter family protein [Candidatus Bilamarchaeum dharawalense]
MQRNNLSKGLMLALAAAVISGISVFVNGMAVKMTDPIVYTAMKNIGALIFLVAVVFAFNEIKNFRNLSRKQWALLILVGIIGGSIPFGLFFWGLKLGGAVVSSFIYRSLFLFAAVFGFLILKEKPERNDLIAAFLILAGNAILLSSDLTFGLGQMVVLVATVFWALEYTISRKLLADIEPRVLMVSRMLFGSVVLLSYMFVTGSASSFIFDSSVLIWLGITSLLLFGFMTTWYTSLKYIPVFKATAIFTLGGIVTTVLNLVFLNTVLTLTDLASIVLILIGCAMAIGLSNIIKIGKITIDYA